MNNNIIKIITLSFMLNGCIVAPFSGLLIGAGAEGVSIQTTGNTISENLKEMMLGEEDVVKKVPIPRRKPLKKY